jgi:hypothetical protein
MIYLKYVASTVGPVAPGSVHVVAIGPGWVKSQVDAEMGELFPAARPTSVGVADLVVVAGRSSDLAPQGRTVAKRCGPHALLWLYSIDTGRVGVVVPREVAHWDRRDAVMNRAVLWAKAHPARWRMIGTVTHLLPWTRPVAGKQTTRQRASCIFF